MTRNRVYASIISHLEREKREITRNAREISKKLTEIIRGTKKGNTIFYIKVGSLWTEEGEKDVELTKKGKLEEIFAEANNEFSRVNNRTDSKRYHRIMMIGEGIRVPIPDEICRKYLPDYCPRV